MSFIFVLLLSICTCLFKREVGYSGTWWSFINFFETKFKIIYVQSYQRNLPNKV